METLAPLRPSPANLTAIVENDPGLRTTRAEGDIRGWLTTRHLGDAQLTGAFVDLGAAASIAYLRHPLANVLARFRVPELDLSVLTGLRREITMEISRFIHELESHGRRRFDGIRYPSKLGYDIVCWAVFSDSSAALSDRRSAPLDLEDRELQRALRDCRLV